MKIVDYLIIGATICIGQEILFLPSVGFFVMSHEIQVIYVFLTQFEVFELRRSVRQFEFEYFWIQDKKSILCSPVYTPIPSPH